MVILAAHDSSSLNTKHSLVKIQPSADTGAILYYQGPMHYTPEV